MPLARNPFTPHLVRTDDRHARENDKRIVRQLDRLSPAASGVVMEVNLVAGDNLIRPPMKSPQGYYVTYRGDGTVTLTDKGLDDQGNWVITASGPGFFKLSFH